MTKTVVFDDFDGGAEEQTLDQVSDALLEWIAPNVPEAQAELDRRRAAKPMMSSREFDNLMVNEELHTRAAKVLDDDEPDEPLTPEQEADVEALIAVLEALTGKATRGVWKSELHPRGPDGRFISNFTRIMAQLENFYDIDKPEPPVGAFPMFSDPFHGFNREQLRRVARARGIKLKRGESREDIADRLMADLESHGFYRPTPTDRLQKKAADHADAIVNAPLTPRGQEIRQTILGELNRQIARTPNSMLKLHGVDIHHLREPGGKDFIKEVGANTAAYYTLAVLPEELVNPNSRIVISPMALDSPAEFYDSYGPKTRVPRGTRVPPRREFVASSRPGLEAVVAHEYGHHVTKLITSNTTAGAWEKDMADEFFPVLARALGFRNQPVRTVDRDQHAGGAPGPLDGAVEYGAFDTWVAMHQSRIAVKVSYYGSTSGLELLAEIWTEYTTYDHPRPFIVKIGKLMERLAEERASRVAV